MAFRGDCWSAHGQRALVALGALALSGSVARAADEGWLELRSPHFVVVSNADEARARAVADDLEGVRRALRRALADDGIVDSQRRVVVLVVKDEQDLRALLPQFWEENGQRPVAAYSAGPYQDSIALRVDASGAERRRRLVHEYVHLLIRTGFPAVPAWLSEGLSEFWSTIVVGDDGVEVGRPGVHHLRTLRARRTWIPLDELLAMDRAPAAQDRQRLSLFYAQSWALAHYVMLSRAQPALELVPSEYIEHLREGADPVTAARRAFGDLSALGGHLVAYVRAGRFRTVRVQIPQAEASGRTEDRDSGVRVRTLLGAESLAIRAGLLVDGERPTAAWPLLAEALRLSPNHPLVLETVGRLRFQENNPKEAARWFDRAIDTAEASHLAYFYRAILAEPVRPRPGGQDGADARNLLQRAIDLNSEFAPAYARLAALYAGDDGDLEAALPLMRRAADLEPESAGYWVELGKLLMRLNRPEEAREAGKRGLASTRSASSRRLLETFLENLNSSCDVCGFVRQSR